MLCRAPLHDAGGGGTDACLVERPAGDALGLREERALAAHADDVRAPSIRVKEVSAVGAVIASSAQ